MSDTLAVPARAGPSGGVKIMAGLSALAALFATVAFAAPGRIAWSDAAPGDGGASVPVVPRLALDPSVFDPDAPLALASTAPVQAPGLMAPGVVRSADEAVIASRMTALITALPLEAGQGFARGQLLASFDCSQMKAQLTAAQAVATAYRKTYDTNVELDQYKAIGTNEVAVSKANLGKATAEAQAIAAGTGQCTIRAPFAGSVVERMAHPHDVAASGQPLMKIQGAGNLEVELIVPSHWLTWLKPGTPFAFSLDETGGSVAGRILRLGAAIDPVSKTMRVTGTIVPRGAVLPGMSGTARFARGGLDGRAA